MTLYFSLLNKLDEASNVYTCEDNPPYTPADFFTEYPQFGMKSDGTALISAELAERFIRIMNSQISARRYEELWHYLMGLGVAHFATLWLRNTADPDADKDEVVNSSLTKGVITSKSAGSLSVSYDTGTTLSDYANWGFWKETEFGKHFITFVRAYNKGGFYVI